MAANLYAFYFRQNNFLPFCRSVDRAESLPGKLFSPEWELQRYEVFLTITEMPVCQCFRKKEGKQPCEMPNGNIQLLHLPQN